EVKAEAGIVGKRGDRLHLGEHLCTALGLLRSRGTGAVTSDIILQASALGILQGLRRGNLRDALGALFFKPVIIARVKTDLAALEVEDGVDDIVQEVALVADDNEGAIIG